jgi:predicted nucleic acid-binding protein
LIDLLAADRIHGERSREAVRRCLAEGSLIASEVVFAEVAVGFPSSADAAQALNGLGVDHIPIDVDAALAAGDAFRAYRQRGGGGERVIADFLIGAHAMRHADRLLTRDRGFFAGHFTALDILDPSS